MRSLPSQRVGLLARPFVLAILSSCWMLQARADARPSAEPKSRPRENATQASSEAKPRTSRQPKDDSRPATSRTAANKEARQARPPSDPSAAAGRARWADLPKEKRQAIQQIYERIRNLPPAQRKRLLDSLEALDAKQRQTVLREAAERSKRDPIEAETIQARRQILRRSLNALSPQEREKLREMSAEERKRFLQERAAAEREKQIAALPAAERDRLRRLSPREQTAHIRQIKGGQLLQSTFREPREVAALRRLRPRELVSALRPDSGAQKRPAFVTPASWKRWLGLKPYERTRVLRAVSSARQPPSNLAPSNPTPPNPTPPNPAKSRSPEKGQK